MNRISYLVVALLIHTAMLAAQSRDVDGLVAAKIRMVEEGRAEQVKLEMPALVSKYQNHPGVLYLQGLLAKDGVEAATYYQMVLDNFPKSAWGDDALYRIYLYYYSLGLARTAELKMQRLRRDYPNSPYFKERPPLPVIAEEIRPPVVPDTLPIRTPVIPNEPEPLAGGYAVQVGAFSALENAMRLKSFFEELNYTVEVQNKVRGGRSLHLVWVGRFSTSDEARKFGSEIKAKHKIESIVVTR